MDEPSLAFVQQIPPDDWERTPSSVKQLVEEMQERLGQLEKKLAELQAEQQLLTEKTSRTSRNSSQADRFGGVALPGHRTTARIPNEKVSPMPFREYMIYIS